MKNVIIYTIMFLCPITLFAVGNPDDYFELISYAANPQLANYHLAEWAKEKLRADSRAVPFLIKSLDTKNSRTLWESKNLLRDIGSQGVPGIIATLADTLTTPNVVCIKVLGEIGDSLPGPDLVPLLHSQYTPIRDAAAQAMGGIGYRPSIPLLINLAYDTYAMVRKSALVSLRKLAGDTAIIECLTENLDDSHYFVRFAALEALEQQDTESVILKMLEILEQEYDTGVITAALKIMNYFSFMPSAFASAVTPFLDCPDEVVQAETIRYLAETDYFADTENLAKIKAIDLSGKPLLRQTIKNIPEFSAQ